MKIIDRYLLRQFLQTFFICFSSLTGLIIVFDAFTNLDHFMQVADKQGGLLRVMGRYYGCSSFLFFDQTLGLLTLTSAMFTVAWIQRHHEMTALLAAGISRVRVVIPIVGAVAVIIVLGVFNRELVIPEFREQLARKPRDLAGDAPRDFTPQFDEQTDIHISGRAAYADGQRIDRPIFRLPPALDSYARQIVAREAVWLPADGTRPAGFLASGVEQPKELAKQASLILKDRPVIVTPRDAPDWLRPDQCFLATDVTFEQLTNGQAWRKYSSTAQLIRGLHNRSVEFGADVRVAVHARIVQPFLDFTLLFLGLPLILTRGSRNVFVAMGMCGIVVSGFMLVVLSFQYLGRVYTIGPTLAAWAPLMIFAPIAAEMAHGMKK